MNSCNHSAAAWVWAKHHGCVLPHCGSPTCGICPGEHVSRGPTRLAGPIAIYSMPVSDLAGIRNALGHTELGHRSKDWATPYAPYNPTVA